MGDRSAPPSCFTGKTSRGLQEAEAAGARLRRRPFGRFSVNGVFLDPGRREAGTPQGFAAGEHKDDGPSAEAGHGQTGPAPVPAGRQ